MEDTFFDGNRVFDRSPFENVVSSQTTVPDKIIFIGDGWVMRKFDLYYETEREDVSDKGKDSEKKRKKKEEDEKLKDLAPEEKELKNKSIKDFWVIGVVSIVLILAVGGGTVFLYNSGNRKILFIN